MLEVAAGLLMLAGPIAAVAMLVLLLGALGLMAFDAIASRKRERAAAQVAEKATVWNRPQEVAESRIFLERGFARAFVIAGGVFWAAAAFAGLYSFRDAGPMAFLGAAVPLLATIVTLVVGWYWERIAAIMLAVASVGAVYYGITAGFEAGVWMLVTVSLIGPMVTASVLFWLARREFEALELRLAEPEMAVATASGAPF